MVAGKMVNIEERGNRMKQSTTGGHLVHIGLSCADRDMRISHAHSMDGIHARVFCAVACPQPH